jgi:hypothetical protein
VEAARVAEWLPIKQAMKLLGLSRSSYYRQVREMRDYRVRGRQAPSGQHREALREVALKRVEAGHRRVRAYAVARGKLAVSETGSSRMSCYRLLKSEGLLQPKRIGYDLRQAAEQRRQRLKAPEKINQVLQSDFTDYLTEDTEKHPQTIGREERFHGSLKIERLYLVLPRNRTELIEAVKSYRQFYNHERLT